VSEGHALIDGLDVGEDVYVYNLVTIGRNGDKTKKY